MTQIPPTPPTDEDLKIAYQLGNISSTLISISRDVSRLDRAREADKVALETLIKEQILPVLEEHDGRLTALEKWRWMAGGAFAVLIFVVPFAINYVMERVVV